VKQDYVGQHNGRYDAQMGQPWRWKSQRDKMHPFWYLYRLLYIRGALFS